MWGLFFMVVFGIFTWAVAFRKGRISEAWFFFGLVTFLIVFPAMLLSYRDIKLSDDAAVSLGVFAFVFLVMFLCWALQPQPRYALSPEVEAVVKNLQDNPSAWEINLDSGIIQRNLPYEVVIDLKGRYINYAPLNNLEALTILKCALNLVIAAGKDNLYKSIECFKSEGE